MPRFLVDSNCIIAILCAWHQHHELAVAEVDRRLDRGEELVAAAPSLVEAYSVLTRLPPPNRLSPIDAQSLLEANFLSGSVTVTALSVEEYITLLRQAPDRGIAGGTVFGAVIGACATLANVDAILTFNEHHFRLLGLHGIQVVVPA